MIFGKRHLALLDRLDNLEDVGLEPPPRKVATEHLQSFLSGLNVGFFLKKGEICTSRMRPAKEKTSEDVLPLSPRRISGDAKAAVKAGLEVVHPVLTSSKTRATPKEQIEASPMTVFVCSQDHVRMGHSDGRTFVRYEDIFLSADGRSC